MERDQLSRIDIADDPLFEPVFVADTQNIEAVKSVGVRLLLVFAMVLGLGLLGSDAIGNTTSVFENIGNNTFEVQIYNLSAMNQYLDIYVKIDRNLSELTGNMSLTYVTSKSSAYTKVVALQESVIPNAWTKLYSTHVIKFKNLGVSLSLDSDIDMTGSSIQAQSSFVYTSYSVFDILCRVGFTATIIALAYNYNKDLFMRTTKIEIERIMTLVMAGAAVVFNNMCFIVHLILPSVFHIIYDNVARDVCYGIIMFVMIVLLNLISLPEKTSPTRVLPLPSIVALSFIGYRIFVDSKLVVFHERAATYTDPITLILFAIFAAVFVSSIVNAYVSGLQCYGMRRKVYVTGFVGFCVAWIVLFLIESLPIFSVLHATTVVGMMSYALVNMFSMMLLFLHDNELKATGIYQAPGEGDDMENPFDFEEEKNEEVEMNTFGALNLVIDIAMTQRYRQGMSYGGANMQQSGYVDLEEQARSEADKQYNEMLTRFNEAQATYATVKAYYDQKHAEYYSNAEYIKNNQPKPEERRVLEERKFNVELLQQYGVEAHDKINLLTNSTSRQMVSKEDQARMEELRKYEIGLRRVVAREKEIEESIKNFTDEKEEIDAETRDAEERRQAVRQWAKDMEGGLSKVSQDNLNLARELEAQNAQVVEQSKREIEKCEKSILNNKVLLENMKLRTSGCQYQIMELQARLMEALKRNGQQPIGQYVVGLEEQERTLLARLEIIEDMLIGQFKMDQAKRQVRVDDAEGHCVDGLLCDYEELVQVVGHTREDCQSHIGEIESLDGQKKELDKLVEESNKVKAVDMALHKEITEQIRREKEELRRVKQWERDIATQVKNMRSGQNKNLVSEYNKLQANIKDKRLRNGNLMNEKQYNEIIISHTEKLLATAESLYQEINTKGTSDANVVQYKNGFTALVQQAQKINSDMMDNRNASFERNETSAKENGKKLAKLLQKIEIRIRPDMFKKSIEQKVVVGQGSTSHFRGEEAHYKELSEFGTKLPPDVRVIFPPTVPEPAIELATRESLIRLIFNPCINRNTYYNQLILCYHNIGADLPDVIRKIRDVLNNISNKKTVQMPELANLDFSDCTSAVVEFVKTWIGNFRQDFYKNRDNNIVAAVTELLDAAKSLSMDDNDDVEALQVFITGISTASDMPMKFLSDYPYKTDDILEIAKENPREIARHFAMVEAQRYRRIQRSEFVKCGWTKPNRDEIAPNLSELTKHFNLTSSYITCTIVGETDIKNRVSILSRWIRIMEESLILGNFNLIFEIDGSLTNPAIIRLKKTWARLEKQDPELKKTYQALSSLTAPFRKFGKYKQELNKKKVDETLPYLGPWLTEMIYIDEGNPTRRPIDMPDGPQADGIHFLKQMLFQTPIDFLLQDWGYTLVDQQIYKPLYEKIVNIMPPVSKDSEIFDMSRKCEA